MDRSDLTIGDFPEDVGVSERSVAITAARADAVEEFEEVEVRPA